MGIKRAPAVATLFAVGCIAAWPGHAGESASRRTIRESGVREISARRYTELLRLACANGFRYRRTDIGNGYRRHYEELRLAFIDAGYAILPDRTPSHLVVLLIAADRVSNTKGLPETGCFRLRWSDR